MNSIALNAKVGLAACAVAASAVLVPITVAEAAPVQAPATPVLSQGPFFFNWGRSGSTDLLRLRPVHTSGFFFFHNLFNCWKPYKPGM
jgi:hypothetical protein